MKMKKTKILFFDIETAPNLAYVWTKYLDGSVIEIKDEWHMLSFAYKWQGDKTVSCVSMNDFKDPTDRHVVKALHSLLASADVWVAHNGDQFDLKKAKARFLFYGLPPTPSVPSVDTKKVAKKHFNFNSNSLADIGNLLKLGKKVKHPGFEMWKGCMSGCQKSWALMEKYNKQDVVLLEKVYDKMKPWMDNHPSLAILRGIEGCPNCASFKISRWGIRATNGGARQRWVCKDCNNNFLTSLSKKINGK